MFQTNIRVHLVAGSQKDRVAKVDSILKTLQPGTNATCTTGTHMGGS